MLRLEHLYTGYGRKVISEDLNGALFQGTLTALLGPNGAGKSTLLRTLSGFLPPLPPPASATGGLNKKDSSVILNGRELNAYSPRDLARTLSVVLTFRPEAESLTVEDVVYMGRIPYSQLLSGYSREDREQVERAIELTGIEQFRKRGLQTLSDGERQRVFIAKALAQATPLILLDEPTAFLDFPSKVNMLRLLSKLAHEEGKTILISTHDVEPALQISDSLWLLNHTGLTSGSPKDLAQRGDIHKFFHTEGVDFDEKSMRFIYQHL